MTVRPFFRFLLRAVLLAGFVAFVVAALQGPLRLAWLLHQGAYFEAHKEYTRAIAAYERALELRPQVTSHLRIGEIYLIQGRYEVAEEEFQEAYRLDPKEEEALLGLGSVAAARGNEEEAMERWMEVLTLDETNAEAHYRLGRAYIDRSQWSSAQEELEKAAGYGEGEARFYLGLLLAREDQGTAVSYLEEVVRGGDSGLKEASDLISALKGLEGAEEADLAAGLGHIYLRYGLPTLAREELARALSLDPEQHLARSYLG
ncbi:MAG: tetratricopeptide repeat protein, partial [Anaerolineae bacterium]